MMMTSTGLLTSRHLPSAEPSPTNTSRTQGFGFTRRFFFLLTLGLIPIMLSGIDSRLVWLTAAYNVVLIGAAAMDLWRCQGADDFSLRRIFDPPVCLGFSNRVAIEVSNLTERLLRLRVLDELPLASITPPRDVELQVPCRATASADYFFKPSRRGRVRFENINARVKGRLRLVWREVRVQRGEEIRVYPDLRGARQLDLALRTGRPEISGLRKLRYRGHGREFESLREFVAGDCLHHVVWSATARRGKLVIKEFQAERNQTILIMIDAGRMMTARVGSETKMDHAVSAALGLVWAARAHGDYVGLLIFCRKVEHFLPPRSGSHHFAHIMEILSEAQPQLVESNYRAAIHHLIARQRRRALVVLLSDIIDRDSSSELLNSFSKLAPRHLPLLLAMRDADLDRVMQVTPRTLTEVYQQGVAEGLRLDRQIALNHFIRGGALALDTSPAGASADLIQHYLEIKEKGLL